jgi:hypothetical protein
MTNQGKTRATMPHRRREAHMPAPTNTIDEDAPRTRARYGRVEAKADCLGNIFAWFKRAVSRTLPTKTL